MSIKIERKKNVFFVKSTVPVTIGFAVQNNIRDYCGEGVCEFSQDGKTLSFQSFDSSFHGNSLETIVASAVKSAEEQFWSLTKLKKQIRDALNKCKEPAKILQLAEVMEL